MSALLALTAAMAGTVFDCEVVTRQFTVFAPDAEATANFRGNVLTLYKLEPLDEAFGTGMKIEQVLDALPDNLFISLDDGEDAPVEITLYELDYENGTAKAAISEDLTPFAAKQTRIELEGSCRFRPQAGKDAG